MEEESPEELEALLERLEIEEREVSTLRRKLHDRLARFPNEVTMEQEREISAKRHELHAQIDELRVKLRHVQGRD